MYHVASEETYQDGQIIFKEGSSGDWVYVVQSGAVEVYKSVGGKRFVLDRLEPGDIFGEIGFISGLGRIATAQAVGETTIGIIDREFLDREFNKLSEDFRLILVALAHRLKKTNERAVEFAVRKEPRVSKVLPVVFKHGEAFIKAYLGNMSTWGLFIGTEDTLEPGRKFSLRLDLPGLSDPLKIKCEVVWTRKKGEDAKGRPPGMGIKFRDINKKDYEILKHYLEAQGTDKKNA